MSLNMVSECVRSAWYRTYAWLQWSRICDSAFFYTTYVTYVSFFLSLFTLPFFPFSLPNKIASCWPTSYFWLHAIHLGYITYMLFLFRYHINIFCHMLPLLLISLLHAHALSMNDLPHALTCMLATCKPTLTTSFIYITFCSLRLFVLH